MATTCVLLVVVGKIVARLELEDALFMSKLELVSIKDRLVLKSARRLTLTMIIMPTAEISPSVIPTTVGWLIRDDHLLRQRCLCT
jgi:hypothetical protein